MRYRKHCVAFLFGARLISDQLLYDILQSFTTKHVLTFAPVSRRFHAISVRILQNRLTAAATLLDHVLMLELYPPSARLTAGKLFCTSLGTSGLDDKSIERLSDSEKIGHLGKAVYSRFRPQHQEILRRPSLKHPCGDVPGSRTHPSSADPMIHKYNAESNLVSQEVSLDAGELFTQLIATLMLVKPGPRPDTILTAVEVCEGTIRVWRDWLAKQAKTETTASFSAQADDSTVLWVNTADHAVGVKFRVRERKWKRDNPVLFYSEEEVAVSYTVDLEEVVVRTSHLLFMVEESLREQYDPLSRQLFLRPV